MLEEKLKLIIKKNNNISFSDYMEIVLFDKEFGFYEKEHVLGKKGHFITSPLVSENFSHCIAKNYMHVVNQEMISNIVELGAGNAELASNLVLYLRNKNSLPKRYYFLEKSSQLVNKQKEVINDLNIKEEVEFIWVDKYEDLPNEAFIIANELLDCIPTDLVRYKDSHYQKAYFNENLQILWKEYDLFSEEAARYLSLPKKLPNNYTFEFSLQQYKIIDSINKFIDKAYFVIIDYGYSANELYIDDRVDGTIACIKDHLSDFNPLNDIGKKDISSFVNFTYIKKIFEINNWFVNAFMNQANYLLSFDILSDMNINDINELESIKKLIMPNQMGEIFKVLIVQKNMSKISKDNYIKNDIIKL